VADKGTLSKIAMQKPMLQEKRLSMKILRLAIGRANIVTKLLQMHLVVVCMKNHVERKVLLLIKLKR
jgi:hypothetical protein